MERNQESILGKSENMHLYYKRMRDNWRDRLTGNTIENPSDELYQQNMDVLTKEAQKCWDTMEKGGNERKTLWNDIPFFYQYQATISNVTECFGTAFSRMEKMACAYTSKGSALYHNEELKKDIIGALEWVYANLYHDKMDAQKDIYGNWWHWFIGVPKILCNIIILMYEELDPDLIDREAKTLENFNWDPNERYVPISGELVKNAAGNLIDTSLVAALRGAIGETGKPLDMAREALSSCLGYVTSGNGYYIDGSYVDHTNLAYTGGYGFVLLSGIEKLLFLIADTPWNVEDQKLTSIFEWILNGIRPLFAYGAAMDLASGRGIARPSTNDHVVGGNLLKPIVHLAELAPVEMKHRIKSFAKTQITSGMQYNKDEKEYFKGMLVADIAAMQKILRDDSLEEDREVYHKNFGVMDKAAYHGEDFAVGISMYSNRIGNFEYGNCENRKGWHQSDGVLSLYNGDQTQYADAYWPTVDSHRLSGITTDHTAGFIPSDNTWGAHTSSKNWVGGSSVLGKFGSVGMDFEGELPTGEISSLKAKKSWFTFPNAVAALGAGIQSSENKETETIVENRKVRQGAGNVIWADGKKTEFVLGEKNELDTHWLLLEGNHAEKQNIGYYFPEQTKVHVLKETRTGRWSEINGAVIPESPIDTPIDRSYISFAINHGINPQGETYSYILLPGRTGKEMEEFAENPQIKILVNTEKVQAVENMTYGVSGYNFWEAANVEGLEVSAQTPASVTIAKEENRVTLGISNPRQNGEDIVVTVQGCYEVKEADEAVSVLQEEGNVKIQIHGGLDFGKTYHVAMTTKVRD